jgi:mono/diheme cytochrome c family protein
VIRRQSRVLGVLTAILAIGVVAGDAAADDGTPAPDGGRLYARYCLACHGATGDGGGPAAPWLLPRPRDFTRGEFKWRTTKLTEAPTKDDLLVTLRYGAPGTSMPGFLGILDDAELDAVIATTLAFIPADAARPSAAGIPAPAPPPVTDASIAKGKEAFTALGCIACHGDGLRGDGTAAANLHAGGRPNPPYDLTAQPLHRPRPSDAPDLVRAAIWQSVTYGVAGTPMPSIVKNTPPEIVWALVDYVDSARWKGPASPLLSDRAIAADRDAATPFVTWPGHGAPDEAAIWGAAIPPQGDPPAALAPAEASLSSQQCARCHAKQAREWKGSLHAHAMSPGVVAQIARPTPDAPTWEAIDGCQRCHAPLAEQLPVTRITDADNPAYDAALRDEGITCASCHVRGWTRHGPPRVAPSLVDIDSYPLVTLELYERSDFCLPCHQQPARTAIAGRPLLDTYREWLDGPYMRRGVQCQHCHMPNREHTWKGVHDPDTFRQGISVTASGERRPDGAIAIAATLRNVGAGHYLPTTPTPAAWLAVQLLDGDGVAIAGTKRQQRIGRKIRYQAKTGWIQDEDTRVPPGEAIAVAATIDAAAAAGAAQVEVTVTVHPDDYYEGFYAQRLAGKLADDVRASYADAARRAEASHYEAYRKRVRVRAAPTTDAATTGATTAGGVSSTTSK